MELLEDLYATVGHDSYNKFIADIEKITSSRSKGLSEPEVREFITIYLAGWSAALEFVKEEK